MLNSPSTAIASPMYEYILTVLREDLGTKVSRRQRSAAKFDLDQSKGPLYPQINLRGQSGVATSGEASSTNNNFGLFLNQVIFDKGKSSYVSVSKALLNEKEYAIKINQEQVVLEAGLLFLNYIEALKREKISKEHTLRSFGQRKIVKDQLAGGRATQIDLQNVEISIKSQQLSQLNFKSARKLAALALSQRARNRAKLPNSELIPRFSFAFDAMNLQEAKKFLGNKPDISLISARIKSLETQIDYSKAKSFPIIGFEASLETSGLKASENIASLKLSASWNLYDGGTQRSEYSGLLEQKKGLSLSYRQLNESYYSKYLESLGQYQSSMTSLQLSKELKLHYKEFLTQKTLQYRGGLVTIEDVLDAQTRLFEVEQQLVGAEIAMTKAAWQVLGHLGVLQPADLKDIFSK